KATLTIFNILGEEVRKWKLEESQGSVIWNGKDELGNTVSSGVYLYRLQSGKEQITKKMLLLK
ncbi:MAG: T9SS C-terminal target domain-containing protein, partial [Calditrichaeota bacterium]